MQKPWSTSSSLSAINIIGLRRGFHEFILLIPFFNSMLSSCKLILVTIRFHTVSFHTKAFPFQ